MQSPETKLIELRQPYHAKVATAWVPGQDLCLSAMEISAKRYVYL